MDSGELHRATLLQRLLGSGEPDRIAQCVALGPEALAVVLGGLPAPVGLGFQPGWRVKRALWPAIQRDLARVVCAQLDAPALDPYRPGLWRWVPPDLWSDALLGEHAARSPDGLALVRVPAARVSLGPRNRAEEVVISRDLWVSTTPVTAAIWARVLGEPAPSEPQRPVSVSHADAVRFCDALSAREGLAPGYVDGERVGPDAPGYRLLTEAEWEHAARAGTDTETYAGDVRVRYGANPHLDPVMRYDEPEGPVPPVATRLPNAFGLFDMLGLAWERVQDAWTPRHPQGVDPCATEHDLPAEARGLHVKRGGDHTGFASLATADSRCDDGRGPCAFRVCRHASEPRPIALSAAPAVVVSPWRHVALEIPHARPQALFTRDGRTWVGLAGSSATALDGVLVCDADLLEVERDLRTPAAVLDVHVVAGTLWASLGPGQLVAWDGGWRVDQELPDAPTLASHGDDLVVGTRRTGLGVRGGEWIPGVRGTTLGSVALDAERVFAGFTDRVRVYDRDGLRLAVLATGGNVALGDGILWSVDQRGTITAWALDGLAALGSFAHPVGGRHPARVRAWGDRVVVWHRSSVGVYAPDGTCLLRWACPTGHRVTAAFPIRGDLHVAIADDAEPRGRVLRL